MWLREPLLALSRNSQVKELLTSVPATAGLVARYVPGETAEDALGVVADLAAEGLLSTLDYLGEDTTDEAQAEATVQSYWELLELIAASGLRNVDVSLKLSAIGQALPGGPTLALANARRICRFAHAAGVTITLDMEDHHTTGQTLETVFQLRQEWPDTAAVLQSYLFRTPEDALDLNEAGSRVRLCKGAYAEPEGVAYQDALEVSRAYVRVLKTLLRGEAYPMIATHDPKLIKIATTLAARYGRAQGSYEFQMLYGVRPEEQRRLAQTGEKVRVYVPYGEQWYAYLMRRLAERPANLALFARSLASGK